MVISESHSLRFYSDSFINYSFYTVLYIFLCYNVDSKVANIHIKRSTRIFALKHHVDCGNRFCATPGTGPKHMAFTKGIHMSPPLSVYYSRAIPVSRSIRYGSYTKFVFFSP